MRKAFIMSKTPFLGATKTKLDKCIGRVVVKRFTINNIDKIKKIFNSRNKTFNLYYYFSGKYKFRSNSFSYFNNCVKQVGYDMGEKIWYLKKKEKLCFNSIVLFGSDIPAIRLEKIEKAFDALKKTDVVIGPSYDGGFWLIGFSNKKEICYPFKNIRWSTSHTLVDLLRNLKSLKINYVLIEKLRDIDIFEDYCNYNVGSKKA